MIVSLSDAKKFLDVSGADDDDVITDMIEAAGEAFRLYCGRRFEAEELTEYHNGTGTAHLFVNEPGTGARAWQDEDLEFPASTEMTPLVQQDRMVALTSGGYWIRGTGNVKVTYTAGYAAVPDDVQHAAMVQVASWYRSWQSQKKGQNILADESVGGWNQSFRERQGLDTEVRVLLQRYKVLVA